MARQNAPIVDELIDVKTYSFFYKRNKLISNKSYNYAHFTIKMFVAVQNIKKSNIPHINNDSNNDICTIVIKIYLKEQQIFCPRYFKNL